jgi:hypothetical protein
VTSMAPFGLVQEVLGEEMPVMVNGSKMSSTRILAELVHPSAEVTVTEYVPPGIVVGSSIRLPLDQRYV